MRVVIKKIAIAYRGKSGQVGSPHFTTAARGRRKAWCAAQAYRSRWNPKNKTNPLDRGCACKAGGNMMFLTMSCHPQMNPTAIARLCFALLLLCAAATSAPSHGSDLVVKLDQAEFILDDSEVAPPDSAPWKPQSLPDNWNLSRPNVGGFGWYRIPFVLAEPPTQLYAVYATKIAVNGAFYLNGQYLGSGGVLGPVAIARNANRPQFLVAAPQLFKSGSNVLHVRIWGAAVIGGLAAVQIGPEAELRPLFERRYLIQVQFQQISAALIGFVAVLMLFLWIRRPHDTMYGYLGASCLTAMGHVGIYVVRDPPIGGFGWDILCLTALGFSVAFYALFVLRFTGRRWPNFEALLWLYVLVIPLALAIGDWNSIALRSPLLRRPPLRSFSFA
jgi:hypothetical protein